MTPPYDAIAQEYYDPFHKTCRNFDATAKAALQPYRAQMPQAGLVLDVGAGKGSSNDLLGICPTRIIQLDSSPKMLSLTPREDCLVRIQHGAESLPFPDASIASVNGFLCDPFFGLDFLAECHRVLEANGVLLCTTPSYEWGQPLREDIKRHKEAAIDVASTRFKTLNGDLVIVPSHLFPEGQIAEMLVRAGFAKDRVRITSHTLPAGVNANDISLDIARSARLKCVDPAQLPILYCIFALK
jgi:SAM-dependent methyltransferase